ncbi:unnamed protein product [Paramecium sonneborni]|uniref:non-specific serine/threonine protein kinase n=1 Tax=Paramecium sonneborni TaxID=65129 RepID=A0A8S1NDH4_9CILI|nr:unnamed protein product [Paramecium sonneborni]
MAAPDYDQFRKIRVLGEGAFGKAILVEDIRDGTQWVKKQIDISSMLQKEKEETIKEAKILQHLDHPNIVKFKDVYATKQGKLCIVMEYADGGDLALKIKNQQGKLFKESQILDWFTQICLALKHVHDRKIIHRDLKGQNIFLTKQNRVKLGDFGIAKILGNTLEKAKTQIGTPYYLSPEIIESKPYSQASDIWSLGAILYELCALKPPFLADSLHFLALKIVKGQFTQIPNAFTKDMNNLVKSLLQLQPQKRPNINQILKMPIISSRMKEFLTESQQKVEFAHTILHKQKINCQANITDLKLIDEDNLRPPPNLLSKQNSTQSQQLLQQPQQVPKQQQQQQQQQQYVPQQQFIPKQQLQQQKVQQQQQQPPIQQQQIQKNNQQYQQQQNRNIQGRQEKPLVQQHVMQQPKQYVQQPRREQQKPNSAAQLQKQRNSSKNKLVDNERQEQERKRMQQIKLEADLRRKEEEKRKLIRLQQEEEAKKRLKDEQKKKREQYQKEMRDDLQKRRQQIQQQQQSQPNLENEPKYIVRQTISQPEHFDDNQLEEYNSDQETNEIEGQQNDKNKYAEKNQEDKDNFEEYDEDNRNMDYGLVQEENEAEIDALQQAIQCKEYEKVMEEVQETNNIVNQLEDAQFEKKRQQILEQFDSEEVVDIDDLEDDDEDFNLTKSAGQTNIEVGLDYFNNPQAMRSYLQTTLGKDLFDKIYKITLNDLSKYQLDEVEKIINNNNTKLIQLLTKEEAKRFIPLMLQLVHKENNQ